MIRPEQVSQTVNDLAPYLRVCEAQVIDFSARAPYGPWLKTRVDVAVLGDLKPGDRLHLMLIKIGDDEMPATTTGERKPYKLSQIAGMLCADEQFRHWITEVYGEPCLDSEGAAIFIRNACNVASRALLDSNPVAGETFRNMTREFDEYKRGRG